MKDWIAKIYRARPYIYFLWGAMLGGGLERDGANFALTVAILALGILILEGSLRLLKDGYGASTEKE